MNRPTSASNLPSIETHARNEIQSITREFDWASNARRPIPREAIEELMVLAFVRGASYRAERHDPATYHAVSQLDSQMAFVRTEIAALRGRREPWADRKADSFAEVVETLRRLRQDIQMRGFGGARLQE